MTPTDALFVRLRNAEGQYLGGDARCMGFFDDVNQAIVFDWSRDHIEQQLDQLRLARGIDLEVVLIDPEEIHETCDRCGRLLLPFHVYFDGRQYLCAPCRNLPPAG